MRDKTQGWFMLRYYRREGDKPRVEGILSHFTADCINDCVQSIDTEYCIQVDSGSVVLDNESKSKLKWLFTETFEPDACRESMSFLNDVTQEDDGLFKCIVEVGPRLAFSTAWSSNCVSMCEACNIVGIKRVERTRRVLFTTTRPLKQQEVSLFVNEYHDRMTECVYDAPLTSFDPDVIARKPFTTIPLMKDGKQALENINNKLGLGFDDWDLEFYTKLFVEKMQRDPTDVECFDLGQSNSEHSRHWFFSGEMTIDQIKQEDSLFKMVKATLDLDDPNHNSIIAYHDNSSSIRGYLVDRLTPSNPHGPAPLVMKKTFLHPILTAETHNFPTGVAPFAGAETGTGGRLRDVTATGRGAHTCAGISAYCVGNLHIPGHPLPWEPSLNHKDAQYPSSLAHPLDIAIQASNGASDYGNKFGEPVIGGFTRSFGQRLPNGERFEFIKPIMFTAGLGSMDSRHATKGVPEVGHVVCKVGGPAYRIGVGGGAASSRVQGTADADLDFDAVQRGDAEMENRMNRIIRACVELGEDNPIVSIHDQGAGGNGNVLKELVEPLGAKYELAKIPKGDPTLSAMELWGAEYQENDAFLVTPDRLEDVLAIGARENCPVSPVGVVTGNGRVTVTDEDGQIPFDLPLSLVLGKMPKKKFTFNTPDMSWKRPLQVRKSLSVGEALDRVCRLLDVGSKRFLTNKVDRSVSGLVAQQQCVGPLHTPLADVSVISLSHYSTQGIASSVGEQPIKGLLDPVAQARMTCGEALTNLMFARISSLKDVKASGNWMWAAKLEGEGAKMWHACKALRDCLLELGPGIDGGKDSLSMAAQVDGEIVKSPGELSMTLYVTCPDITLTVTPDLKPSSDESLLLYIDLGMCKNRMGGTAFSTVFGQLGDTSPSLDNAPLFVNAFETMQSLLDQRVILAGHDRSDGGLLICVMEMGFAGNCGFDLHLHNDEDEVDSIDTEDNSLMSNPSGMMSLLFSEELGFVLQVLPVHETFVLSAFQGKNVPCTRIGSTRASGDLGLSVSYKNRVVYESTVPLARDIWESTSFELEKLQCNPQCVEQEREHLLSGKSPYYTLSYDITPTPVQIMSQTTKHKVAIIRQEGSNGDREMHAAFHMAGFESWDVNMNDILQGKLDLNSYRGIVFVGGFSYADVNDSAKGWAAVIRFDDKIFKQFEEFRSRPNTFTLGICNGCQLMALLGYIPFPSESNESEANSTANITGRTSSSISEVEHPRFIHNNSGRFESRWVSLQIQESPAIMLRGMAGSTLGTWVAHGEGKVHFPNIGHLELVQTGNLAPVRYVDSDNRPTEVYPANPNGSPLGIAGLCSPDGRHLAMMPHPERCVKTWQCPYLPDDMAGPEGCGPWLKMFQNAREFCDSVA